MQVYKAFAAYFDLFNHDVKVASHHGLMPCEWTPSGAALKIVTGQAWTKGQEVGQLFGAHSKKKREARGRVE